MRALATGPQRPLISHKLDEVLAIADRVTVLRAGRVVLAAPRRDVDAARLTQALFGDAPDAPNGVPPAPGEAPPAAAGPAVLRVRALAGPGFGPVDLEVAAGECVGLFGVDGHGQTELLETLIGLRAPASGSVDLPARGVAFVSGDRHGSGLALDLSLAENLALRRELLPAAVFGRAELAAAASAAPEFAVPAARPVAGGTPPQATASSSVLRAGALDPPALVLAENPTRARRPGDGVRAGAAARRG